MAKPKDQNSNGAIRVASIEFYRLRDAQGQIAQAVNDGNAAIEQARGLAQQQVAAAEQKRNALLEQLAKKYRFDPSKPYRFDEKRLALVPA